MSRSICIPYHPCNSSDTLPNATLDTVQSPQTTLFCGVSVGRCRCREVSAVVPPRYIACSATSYQAVFSCTPACLSSPLSHSAHLFLSIKTFFTPQFDRNSSFQDGFSYRAYRISQLLLPTAFPLPCQSPFPSHRYQT